MKKTILLIDDSQMILNFLKVYLSKEYHVLSFNKASAALDYLINYKGPLPDLVLSDYHMPKDLSGLDVIKSMRKYFPVMPVVILSGSCDVDERIECIASGAYDFIEKPFNPRELDARIEKALGFGDIVTKYYLHAS